ncbi:MAG: bifunctional phosphoribosylaminoimidazolecarboxamide formyltransferase/IMP cyclohydrolase [Armatimonadetes bacterium]|nr:bifunctional phosphoribosylaminoimidazolecarboxamide formyltransferase/IMP cyclohydrolase [Armatimonadota bacterium]
MKRRALISVSDKTGVLEFAKVLEAKGFEILSTGGTADFLRKGGLSITDVGEYTGQPEVFGGRVKTLHPKIHGGLLVNPVDPKHKAEMDVHEIAPIEVLAVNLYPFEQTVLGGARRDLAIENIDIGGPAMIRAAAKNAQRVLVVVDPEDYPLAVGAVDAADDSLRKTLQAKAFAHTAYYDSLIAEYLSHGEPGPTLTLGLRLRDKLRYGENSHQKAVIYIQPFAHGGIAQAEQLWGKQLSYNNYLDADCAWELASDLNTDGSGRPCVIVKHGNPCGVAWSDDVAMSFSQARAGDPISAFGGIVAIPGDLPVEAADDMTQKGNFFEVVICSRISPEALDVFKGRSGWGQDVRILKATKPTAGTYTEVRTIRGGALIQEADTDDPVDWRVVTSRQPSGAETIALRKAWIIAKHVKSNAIVVASTDRLRGVGAGQMNRVQSVRFALKQASAEAVGSALASDAFFPFPDSVEAAAYAGVSAIVQPGGSKKDGEVIEAANRLGVAMVFTGVRHFRH